MQEIIRTSDMQAMYKAYDVVIPPKSIRSFNTVYAFFTAIEANGKFNVRFSSSVGFTEFEQGLYAKFNHMMDFLQIENPNETSLILRFGVGSGEFEDNRLIVSSKVATQPAPYEMFTASTATIADGSATIPAGHKVIIQNTGSNVMYIGAADGLQLKPLGTFEYSLADSLTVYGTDGDTIAIGSFD